MPVVINQQASTDSYLGNTHRGDFGSGYLYAAGADILAQIDFGTPAASVDQLSDYPLFSGQTLNFVAPPGKVIRSVAFKSLATGTPATVSGYLGERGALSFQAAIGSASLSNNPIQIAHNGALVGSEPQIDFEDAGAFKWTVADDAGNSRVQVTPPKVITGLIASSGAITAGTGFTVVKGAAGIYTINYTVAFAATPATVITQLQVAGGGSFQINSQSAASFQMEIYSLGGTLHDCPWNFVSFATG